MMSSRRFSLGGMVLGSSMLLSAIALVTPVDAQTAAAKSGSGGASDSASKPDSSIETEMLTYRALETGTEAVACDVAGYLYGTSAQFKSDGSGTVCSLDADTAKPGADSVKPGVGVVVLPFDSPVLTGFMLWRRDMNTMAEIERRATCTPKPAGAEDHAHAPESILPKPNTSSRGLAATSVFTPIGAGTTAAQGVLALLSSEESVASVVGTIKDQALIDGVSRGLVSHKVSVLMPSVYAPFAMTSIAVERSPFLTAFEKLRDTYDCLVGNGQKDDQAVKDIEAFFASLSAAPAAQEKSGSAAATPAPSTASHIQEVLAADGLAQRLGADPKTGTIPDDANEHILMLSALESGGSVIRFSNVFGTRIRYGGGSVSTYALFDLKGQLECSGNVYDYVGAIPSKHLTKSLKLYRPDPGAQVIFERGGCHR